MYKVFINNKRLILANNKEKIGHGNAAIICLKKPDSVNAVVQNHLLQPNTLDLIILSADDKKLIEIFEQNYDTRIAAGGWVWNEKKELLMIYRDQHWDIPKGHLDEGESIKECAKREVREETGIQQLNISEQIGISRHIYNYQDRAVLKHTHWFTMKSLSTERLHPQHEEGIEEVRWVNASEVEHYIQNSWRSLYEFYSDHPIY